MTNRIAPQFYWSEAERLLQLASVTSDRALRFRLLEMAAHYRDMAAELRRAHPPAANSNNDPASESA